MNQASAQIIYNQDTATFQCSGTWSVLNLDGLYDQFSIKTVPKEQKVLVSGEAISQFDSAGALALMKCLDKLKNAKNEVELIHFTDTQKELIELVESNKEHLTYRVPVHKPEGVLYQIGKEAINKIYQIDGLVILIGDLTTRFFEALGHWKRFQLPSIISNIDSAGIKALPILALLSFLIGVVLAYQMGLQLETYGANIFIAYLSGMAIFREFGPLITAIIVAGRTSSSYTAQLGSMKINEEVDAILTMGLSPTELLVMPKVIGLALVFPLLIFWSDLFSIFGSMIMAKHMLGIGYYDFLMRLKSSVGLEQFMLGLYKAPAFSLLIALVGCFQGFRVEANADSIGSQTTRSVVQALFLIIIADAVYSIVYSWMDL